MGNFTTRNMKDDFVYFWFGCLFWIIAIAVGLLGERLEKNKEAFSCSKAVNDGWIKNGSNQGKKSHRSQGQIRRQSRNHDHRRGQRTVTKKN